MKLEAMDACEFLGRAQVYRAADVDALLARIRAAVVAERSRTDVAVLARKPSVPKRCALCGWALYDGIIGQNPACACSGRRLSILEYGWMLPEELQFRTALDALLSGEG